jgi:hypothetical protein
LFHFRQHRGSVDHRDDRWQCDQVAKLFHNGVSAWRCFRVTLL